MSAVVLAHGHQARDDLLVQLEGEDWNQHGARLAHVPNERGVAELRGCNSACAFHALDKVEMTYIETGRHCSHRLSLLRHRGKGRQTVPLYNSWCFDVALWDNRVLALHKP